MFRRAAAVPMALALVLLSPATARGDAPPNDNNCAGVFASALTPELTSGEPGVFGESRSAAGKEGSVGQSEQELTEAYASCGEP